MKKVFFLLLFLPALLHAGMKKEICFEENKGQLSVRGGSSDLDVRFILRGKLLTYFFSDCGYSVVQHGENGTISRADFFFPQNEKHIPLASGEIDQPVYYYHANGNQEIKSFRKIVYQNALAGADLEFFMQADTLVRQIRISNANSRSGISMIVSGAETVPLLNTNGYAFRTAAGMFSEKVISTGCEIRTSASVAAPGLMKFKSYYQLAARNGNEQTQTNATISWLTYLGGTGADELYGVALLPANSSVVAGRTNSTDFPSTVGAMQDTAAGNYDVSVSCFDSAGVCLWSTYYGGTGFDGAYGVLLADTLLVVFGSTNSTDLPMMNAYQNANAGSYDAFAFMLNASGQLVRSTYFGGTAADQAYAMAIDTAGNIVMAGSTTSTNLPLAASGYQPVPAGAIDAFIATFNLQLQPLWSTCYGGNSSEDIHSVTVSPQGEIIFCGGTYSNAFPVTANAYQSSLLSYPDVYLVKFGMDGTRHYATYFGGINSEDANSVVCDSLGNIYMTGFTYSPDFPMLGNSFQNILAAQSDVYLVKFNPAGIPVWSTFIGGNGPDNAFALYRYGKYLFAAGATESSDFPVNPNGLQPLYAGNSDGFFVKMDTAGNMVASTFQGGGGFDAVNALTITPDDTSVIACGNTYSTNLPVSPGAFQQSNYGQGEGYVLKFGMSEELSTVSVQNGMESENGTVIVYPNPAIDFIRITSQTEDLSRIEIFDATARLVYSGNANGKSTELNIASLAKGHYSIVIYSGKDAKQIVPLVKF